MGSDLLVDLGADVSWARPLRSRFSKRLLLSHQGRDFTCRKFRSLRILSLPARRTVVTDSPPLLVMLEVIAILAVLSSARLWAPATGSTLRRRFPHGLPRSRTCPLFDFRMQFLNQDLQWDQDRGTKNSV
jgi:hypothetical protein